MKKIIFSVVIALTLLLASSAMAQNHTWKHAAVNTTGQAVDDFHAVYTGTGGSITNVVITRDPGANAVVTVTGGNTIDITWDDDSVPAGGILELTFKTTEPSVQVGEAYWTDDGADAGVPDTEFFHEELPSLTTYGLIGLALLIVVSGLWIYRRKRAAAVA